MSQKTYLQLINKVFVNLRETAVADLSAAYTNLIGEFVNVAKETVEDTIQWRALSSEVRFTTIASQVAYYVDQAAAAPAATLVSGNWPDQRSFVMQDDSNNDQAWDITNVGTNVLYPLVKTSRESVVANGYTAAATSVTQPYKFAFTTEGGRPSIILSDPPMGSRLLAFRMCVPQVELAVISDVMIIPWRPVVLLATCLAMQERGEQLGASADLYMSQYNMALLREQEKDRDSSYDQLTADYADGR